MWPDRLFKPGLLTYESGTLPTALRGPAKTDEGTCIPNTFMLRLTPTIV